jgi:hypothetical protein
MSLASYRAAPPRVMGRAGEPDGQSPLACRLGYCNMLSRAVERSGNNRGRLPAAAPQSSSACCQVRAARLPRCHPGVSAGLQPPE